MMESDISSREAEVRTLRGETDALSAQAAAREEEHKSEVRGLSAQLEKACSGAVSGIGARAGCGSSVGVALVFLEERTVFIVFSLLRAN